MSGPAERRTVVVIFAGLDDFASWADRSGPEEARGALDALFTRFRAVVDRMGGHVDKFVGECAMVVFGAPVSHGDDAVRAVRCALGLRAAVQEFNAERGTDFQLRAGLNAGEVLWGSVGGDRATATGDAVNVARRLYEAAEPGCVVVGERVERETARVVTYTALPPVRARNREEPVAAWEVRGAGGGSEVSRVEPVLPLFGRSGEVRGLLAPLAAGGSSFVVVEGEAGIGKSRLLAEVRREGRRALGRLWVAWGRAPDDVRLPLAAFGDIVGSETGIRVTSVQDAERLAAALAGQMESEPAAERENTAQLIVLSLGHELPGARVESIDPVRFENEAHAAWERWLTARAAGAPALLCLEDLHQADEGTRLLLSRLAAAWSGRRCSILCTARPGSPIPAGGTVFPLRELSEGAAAGIGSAVLRGPVSPALAQFLEEKSGGNPYLAEELARFLRDNALLQGLPFELRGTPDRLPSSLTGLLVARLDRQSPETRETIKAASAVGRSFWPGVVSLLAGRPVASDLDAARRAELIERESRSLFPDDPQLMFRHALLRDAAYSLLPRRERGRLHAQAAGELERRAAGSGRAVLALAAGHREAAGEPAAAAALWLRAAEAALAHNASREASDWAARSRAACDTCRAAMVHARALRRIGEVEASVRVSREAVALSGGAGAEASEAWADLAGILQLSSSAADVDHAARRAIELATDRPSWIRGGNALVPALIARGRTEEASRLGDELVEAAEAPGIPGTLATRCREVRAYTRYATRRYEEAIRDWEAAAESWKAAGDRFAYANALNNIAITENTLDRPEQAMARHREAERIRREIGDRLGLAISLTNISNVLHRLRDYDAALALAREALALRRSCGDVAGAGLTLGNIALIHRLQGRISEALAAMREAAQMRTISGNLVEFCDGLIHFARIHSDHGDPAAARECLAEARRSMKSLDRVDLQRSAIWTAIAVEDAHGTPAAGAELRRQYLALCPPEETTSDQVLTVLAGLFGSLLVLGRHDEAGEVLRQLEERARIDPAIHPLVHGLKARRAFDRDPAGAIREVAEAARLVRESGSAPAEFEFLTELVEFQCAAGDVDGAVRTGARIEDLARTLNLVEDFPILLAGARLRSLAAREQRGEALQMADGVLRDLDARGAVRQARSLRTLLGKLGLSDPTA